MVVMIMQKADIIETEREKLCDIDKNDINNASLTHLNNGYVIRVHFSEKNYSATDALKDYLKQISRLKY